MIQQISDDGRDRLVEIFFMALPAMDTDELAQLLGHIIAIVEREIRRVIRDDYRRWTNPSNQ